MNWKDYITTDPAVLFGKPVIRNTRIPVELLLEKMAGGYSNDELLKAYPKITLNDLQACLLFAAESIKHEKVLAV
ncbi:DUF433 domain-containing protein [Parafilimonas terrae]|uniref:Uncharacterized conserved protein, DUF433 family n=1 Tax=Parafilimonas terrae TaxID=1465490 RepID=A0A1I5S0D3_9BACT|nr:DUF433 domain-containing protein [Parafilimonas terrae]SFP64235.1 Uncharacterized conserved protein, DUF433 family [Parafilimonas terrae]